MAFGWGSQYSKYGIKDPDYENSLSNPEVNLKLAKYCIVIGLILIFQHLFWLPIGIYSSFWPKADGKIVSYKVSETKPDWISYIFAVLDGEAGEKTHYGLKITYEYEVNGKQFFGSRVWMEPETTWESEGSVPSEVYEYNKPGKKIKVSYCPFKKDFSVLIPGPAVNMFFVIGLFFFCMGIWAYSRYKKLS